MTEKAGHQLSVAVALPRRAAKRRAFPRAEMVVGGGKSMRNLRTEYGAPFRARRPLPQPNVATADGHEHHYITV